MRLSHKIAIDPTVRQEAYFRQAAGTARLTYNWALAEWDRQYEAGEKPTALKLKKQWNASKYQLYPWLKDIHRDAHAEPFTNLGSAFSRFFKKLADRPKFKKKGKSKDSFYVANDRLRVDSRKVCLPVIGWVKLRESLRFVGKITGAVVSRTANRWFISIQVDVPDASAKRRRTGDNVVGVDLGLKNAVTSSDGVKIAPPKPLHRALRRFRIQSRNFSRKKKGSSNRRKAARVLSRTHAHIANIRQDFWHKVTSKICSESQAVGLEDLNVSGMSQNPKLASYFADVGMGSFKPLMRYKAKLFDTVLVFADRFFPSSKLCSACGLKNDSLTLSDRSWICVCGAHHDRDINSAQNLAKLALILLAILALPAACGKVTLARNDYSPEGQGRNRRKPLSCKPVGCSSV